MAKILVVDDEKVMVKGIRFNLENEGYTVDVGYNGRQAVDLARANDYDLIILAMNLYEPWYTEKILQYMNRGKHPLICFTDYGEIRNGVKEKSNRLLNVKRMMLVPLRPGWASKSVFLRRRVLSFGSPISCPTVSYFLPNLPLPVFASDYKSDLDWQAWEKISRRKGDFLFCKEICMYHRIHEESTTTEVLQEHERCN